MTAPAEPPPTVASVPCREAPVPSVHALTYGQARVWNCYACEARLTSGAVYAGWSRGSQGAHVLNAEVWACP
ncbi:hypothetical protein [Streptomyces sp. NRRL F-5135]|uniref:hypothetical protein n=1 Tax=Streptomyces sp. NRRL F-5135 TaxID=1463858 RepID=UPI0004C6D82D|nr:hypothetical protein [Streptomyces sp. NRRL F-5135]